MGGLKDLFLPKLQVVQQLIELKRTTEEQGSFLSLALTKNDHWLPGGAGVASALPSATAI